EVASSTALGRCFSGGFRARPRGRVLRGRIARHAARWRRMAGEIRCWLVGICVSSLENQHTDRDHTGAFCHSRVSPFASPGGGFSRAQGGKATRRRTVASHLAPVVGRAETCLAGGCSG